MPITQTTDALKPIAEKVAAGTRLTAEDGGKLFASNDIHGIGRLANSVREQKNGNATFYNINRHINYTNYCVLRCRFCSFRRPCPTPRTTTVALPEEQAGDAYELPIETIVEQAATAYQAGATEVHIVGGLHPKLPFSYYTNMCCEIRKACPRIHIKAFTAIEIIHFSRISRPRITIREVLEQLTDAGLDSLPGGGAEIFDDRVHDEVLKNKMGEQGWFDVHRTAHECGIPTNATMLYGHIERPEERITHMLKLREHQDESLASRKAAFNCFIPLAFIPDGSELADRPGPTGLDDLKTLAISRLMLDNIPHIKAFWIMLSAKLAQMALNWGADDLDGTVVHYDITKREAGPGNRNQEMSDEQIKRLIREAGRIPIERNTVYQRVIRDGAEWNTGGPV